MFIQFPYIGVSSSMLFLLVAPKKIGFEALSAPLVHRPTYPFNVSPHLDDVMSLLCGRSIS